MTRPQPFSFEAKDKAIQESRKKRIEEEIIQARRLASAFRAQPMPSPSYISRPDLPPMPPLTSARSPPLVTRHRASRRASFDAHVEERRALAQRQLEEIEREKAEIETRQIAAERKARIVKATPVRKIRLRIPEVQRIPLTRSRTMTFRTEIRAEARKQKLLAKHHPRA
ncbi:hypothetical protein Aperf_G00000105572 [Anoplocephala perfoliata]